MTTNSEGECFDHSGMKRCSSFILNRSRLVYIRKERRLQFVRKVKPFKWYIGPTKDLHSSWTKYEFGKNTGSGYEVCWIKKRDGC